MLGPKNIDEAQKLLKDNGALRAAALPSSRAPLIKLRRLRFVYTKHLSQWCCKLRSGDLDISLSNEVSICEFDFLLLKNLQVLAHCAQ